MVRGRRREPSPHQGRWFFWLVTVLAAVVVADQLQLLPGLRDRRHGPTRVLGEVVTTLPPFPTTAPSTAPPATAPPATVAPRLPATVRTTTTTARRVVPTAAPTPRPTAPTTTTTTTTAAPAPYDPTTPPPP